MMIKLSRGDTVLVAFPFVTQTHVQRRRRPALVVQADRYNRRRAAVILAAITSSRAGPHRPSSGRCPRTCLFVHLAPRTQLSYP
ncbi:MAG: type II toxin-antitoxin system PemK/MazF family toxin [Candidatus Tectomicrobia bacterium]|uniref:Type II toxin-antitoxin system PemK/MazF family toxin n=1 Tax=Tectimicrobiota bacterium TaxID=2528274 RepID=A0A932M1W2_UNCTE|nr:type II toxin-antitoxin system PemK/MazF family toxin [Candidatus Tectomicrobia bacterium]